MKPKKRSSIHVLPAAVYRLFDEHGVLLYVGMSYDPNTRFVRHRRKPWGGQIARSAITWYDNRPTAFRIEADAIKTEQPLYNKTHLGSRIVPIVPKPRELGADIPDDLVAEFMKRTGRTERQVRNRLARGLIRLRQAQEAAGLIRSNAA